MIWKYYKNDYRSGPSGTNRPEESSDEDDEIAPVTRRPRLDSDTEDEPQPPLRTRRRRARRAANPFIDSEAGVDGDASDGSDGSDSDDSINDFIVNDDVEF